MCEANICRSPLARASLANLTTLNIDSAGISARSGDPADEVYIEMAKKTGIDLTEHQSKPVTRDLLVTNDLILVMTNSQKNRVSERYPEFSGKISLLGRWLEGGLEISDPHRKSREAYAQVFNQIESACEKWAVKLR